MLAWTREHKFPRTSRCPCWLNLYTLFANSRLFIYSLLIYLLLLSSLLVVWTLTTIQILMFLNVSAHSSTHCLCLGLQHKAAWCINYGKQPFISKGQFVIKPNTFNTQRYMFHCFCSNTVFWEHVFVFKCLMHFSFWTETLANFEMTSQRSAIYAKIKYCTMIYKTILIVETCFVLLLHTYLLIVLQKCDFLLVWSL